MFQRAIKEDQSIQLVVALTSLLLCGASAHAADGVTNPVMEQRGLLVQQKLMLLDSLLHTQTIRDLQQDGSAQVKADLAQACRLRDVANGALALGDEAAAERAEDAAFRTASSAASASKSALLGPQMLRERNAELEQQILDYRTAIATALQLHGINQEAPAERPALDARLLGLDRLLTEADVRTVAGRHAEANRLLADAYHQAVTSLSELRAGEPVVLEHQFVTPADEYAYQQLRNESHEMLVEMQIQQGLAEGDNRAQVGRYLLENRQLRSRAEAAARSGNLPAAIKAMEDATGRLVPALRLTGMLIF